MKTDKVPLEDEDVAALRPSRTNLLLSASIETNGVAMPVRIRNLSDRGALLEGAALPGVGSSLVLRRLHLEMAGTVIWVDQSRCGVRFLGTIAVAAWREGNWIAPIGNADQMRADGIQAAVRTGQGARVHDVMLDGAALESRMEQDARIALEIVALQHQLAGMGSLMVKNPGLGGENAAVLQEFDLLLQTLGHLAQVLKAEDRDAAIDAIGMEQLQERLQGFGRDEGSAD